MIRLSDKKDCSGCSACAQRCPKQGISMLEDNEGFLYPKVDVTKCIECGLCEKTCPVLHPYEKQESLQVLAAINTNDEIRRQSSSGGIFTLLAEKVIDAGGIVFGARFDEKWQVTLDYTETKDGLAAFRGSKYVQARTADTYAQCERFLKEGRKVLFSGTPCQIAGLKHFLIKEYYNLLTVDFLCHGVPSPKVWAMYLKEKTQAAIKAVYGKSTVSSTLSTKSFIKNVNFRDKSHGWKKFRFVLEFNEPAAEVKQSSVLSPNNIPINECFNENIYMKAFLQNLILRPSCYDCPARSGKSHGDITIADFWGIHLHHPELDDDLGTGLVLVNTDKAAEIIPYGDIIYQESSIEGLSMYNGGLKETIAQHPKREYFFSMIDTCDSICRLLEKSTQLSFKSRSKILCVKILRKGYHLFSNNK